MTDYIAPTLEEFVREYSGALRNSAKADLDKVHQYYLGYTRGLYDARAWEDDRYFAARKQMSTLLGKERAGTK